MGASFFQGAGASPSSAELELPSPKNAGFGVPFPVREVGASAPNDGLGLSTPPE